MTRDFASNTRKPGKTKGSARRRPAPTRRQSPPVGWFLSGLVCGVLLSGLGWLALQQPATPGGDSAGARPVPDPVNTRPEPSFDFYTLLPEQRIEVEADPGSLATAGSQKVSDQFLLQAGSFQQAEDADRRRAELLLLGLDARVEKASTDNGRWFRVYIGPFESRSRLARARGLTAQQGIDTLLLKRPGQAQPQATP